jgi:hypothetical protein
MQISGPALVLAFSFFVSFFDHFDFCLVAAFDRILHPRRGVVLTRGPGVVLGPRSGNLRFSSRLATETMFRTSKRSLHWCMNHLSGKGPYRLICYGVCSS